MADRKLPETWLEILGVLLAVKLYGAPWVSYHTMRRELRWDVEIRNLKVTFRRMFGRGLLDVFDYHGDRFLSKVKAGAGIRYHKYAVDLYCHWVKGGRVESDRPGRR